MFSTVVRKRLLTYFQRRHAAGQRVAEEPAAEHQVALARDDRRDERRDPGRVVLVVGVEHHDDVGAGLQRRVVARLLVAAVAPVLGVDDDVEAELAGDVDGLVARHVVDEDDLVDEVVRDVGVRPLERPRGVVGGHDDDDPGDPAAWVMARRVADSDRGVTGPSWTVVRRYAPSPAHGRIPRPMFERLFGNTAADPAIAERIPPGQYRTEKFPVLHYGSVPQIDLATWDFKVYGEVDTPFTLTWDAVQGAAAQAGPHRHPLRDPLVEARHRPGRASRSRRSSSWPRSGRPRRTSSATPSRATPRTCRSRSSTTTTSCSPTPSTASRSSPSTAIRSACSSRSGTSGRARSGSAASSSSTTTSSASGSATATTTTPTPGRKSASATTEAPDRQAAATRSAAARAAERAGSGVK